MNTLAVILTGGRSRRMGRDKAALPYGEGTLLSHLIGRYAGVFDGGVAVSVDRAGRFPCGGAAELVDLFPGQGPMAGLHAAFSRTDAQTVFLTAVDLPFGSPEAARALVSALGDHDACMLLRQNGHGGAEPSFAVYHRRLLPGITACLNAGKRSIFLDLIGTVDARFLTPEELPGHDWERILTNVNHPAEYEALFTPERKA